MKLIAFALLLCAQVLGSNSYISATEAKECIPKLRALFSDVNSMLGSGAQGSVYSVGCERRGTGPKAVKMCGYVLKLPGQALNAYPDAEVELMQRIASEASLKNGFVEIQDSFSCVPIRYNEATQQVTIPEHGILGSERVMYIVMKQIKTSLIAELSDATTLTAEKLVAYLLGMIVSVNAAYHQIGLIVNDMNVNNVLVDQEKSFEMNCNQPGSYKYTLGNGVVYSYPKSLTCGKMIKIIDLGMAQWKTGGFLGSGGRTKHANEAMELSMHSQQYRHIKDMLYIAFNILHTVPASFFEKMRMNKPHMYRLLEDLIQKMVYQKNQNFLGHLGGLRGFFSKKLSLVKMARKMNNIKRYMIAILAANTNALPDRITAYFTLDQASVHPLFANLFHEKWPLQAPITELASIKPSSVHQYPTLAKEQPQKLGWWKRFKNWWRSLYHRREPANEELPYNNRNN